MGFPSRLFRIPRPQSFLYIMSLQTGATLIAFSLIFNKLIGLYGLLAILTGFHLSPLQLSMYIYSILALVLSAFLAPHIQRQSPLQCLALAWFYLIDSVVNAAYTASFAVTWFEIISEHHHSTASSGPGKSTIQDTAGFTNPKYNVSSVNVATGTQNIALAQEASAPAGTGGNSSHFPSLGNGVLQPESPQSIAVICTLWTIRVYFVLVMMSFARKCIRQHAYNSKANAASRQNSRDPSAMTEVELESNPFSTRSFGGQGWRGKLGRAMVAVGRSYWLDGDQDDSWMFGMNKKFRRGYKMVPTETGVTERERRRRSGTGPPLPSHSILPTTVVQESVHLPSQSQSPASTTPVTSPSKLYAAPERKF